MRKYSDPTQKPKTIDEYLAAVPADKRAALEKLRKAIRAAAPKLTECINYGMPAFRLNGKFLIAFGAAARHCAFYPGATVQAHQHLLKKYDTSKGTIRFQASQPPPAALVRKLVRARIVAKARTVGKARRTVAGAHAARTSGGRQPASLPDAAEKPNHRAVTETYSPRVA